MAGRKPVVETEAFQQAVADAVSAKLDDFKKELLAAASAGSPAPAAAGGSAVDILGEVLSKLTVNLQATNQQGQFNKPLTPEEVVRREKAMNLMVNLINGVRSPDVAQDDKPTYRLTSKVYLNERLIEPMRQDPNVKGKAIANEIMWTGIPNDAMVPLNDSAKAIFNAWRESTGGVTQLVPTADQRPLFMTAAGLVVRGEPPKRQHVAAEPNFSDDLGFTGADPNAPEVAVLGTVAKKAVTNSVSGAH